MNDIDLITQVKSIIDSNIGNFGLGPVSVLQGFQKENIYNSNESAIYISIANNRRVGQRRSYTTGQSPTLVRNIEQLSEATIAIESISKEADISSSDISNIVSLIFSQDSVVKELSDSSIGLIRFNNGANESIPSYIEDDQRQYQQTSIFRLILSYNKTFSYNTESLDDIEGTIHAIEGNS